MRLQKLLTCIFIFLLGTFLYGENSIPKVEYKKVELNSLEDINTWKNSNELYVFRLQQKKPKTVREPLQM